MVFFSSTNLYKIYTQKFYNNKARYHCHKTSEYKFHTYTQKSFNQNTLLIGYDILIGRSFQYEYKTCTQSFYECMSTKLILNVFMTV